MKQLALATALATSFCLSAPLSAQQVGDWVLAPWKGSTQYYPGVVAARTGDQVTIRFDDGDRAKMSTDEVRHFTWKTGSKVECRWTDGKWYNATVRMMDGDGLTMNVRYDDDGVMQRTTTGQCRTRG